MSSRGDASGEQGSITLWLLGLCVALLFLGGISLDLWRAFSERRALAGIADAAAVAGASGVNEQSWRETGVLTLDPSRAEGLALANLAAQTDTKSITAAAVNAVPTQITVTLDGSVNLTLLGLLMSNRPLAIHIEASADPRRSG